MKKKENTNPIDADKITQNPNTLSYPHHIGSANIKPVDKGRLKGKALAAMYEQTDMQLSQIKQQIELLAEQAKAIQDRIEISEIIYTTQINFQPVLGHTYYLYERKNGEKILSMISPLEWNKQGKLKYIATVKLLSDHTWEILEND